MPTHEHERGRVHKRTLTVVIASQILGGVVLSAVADSIPLLCLSLFVYGSGTATNLQTRYSGTDLAPAHRRGFGTSMAMVATTVGAVAGPNLITPMGLFAESIGAPPHALIAKVAWIVGLVPGSWGFLTI